jgi:hypothetical protein
MVYQTCTKRVQKTMKRKHSKGFGVYQNGIPKFTKPVPNGTQPYPKHLPEDQPMTSQPQQFTSIRKLAQHKGVPYTTLINHLKAQGLPTNQGVTPDVLATVNQKWPDLTVPEVVTGGTVTALEVIPFERQNTRPITFSAESSRYSVLAATHHQIQELNAASESLKSYLEASIMQAREMGAQVGAVAGKEFIKGKSQAFLDSLQRASTSEGLEQPGEG